MFLAEHKFSFFLLSVQSHHVSIQMNMMTQLKSIL